MIITAQVQQRLDGNQTTATRSVLPGFSGVVKELIV
jgi:hypothetical protein